MKKDVCPFCASSNSNIWFLYDNQYNILNCRSCDIKYMSPYISESSMDYTDYGSYITSLDDSYFRNRLKTSIQKRIFFSFIKYFFKQTNYILDYGGGAGFFAKSCQNLGYPKTYIYEPSENFRKAAVNKVLLDNKFVYNDLSTIKQNSFHIITMLDVIEHLPGNDVHEIFSRIKKILHPNGLFFGFTPNAHSLNILIHGIKDPVISPPSHVFYFTTKSLDKLMKQHGFRRVFSFTIGFSTNSFFRKSKFKSSWVEFPSRSQKIPALFIKLLFKLISSFLTVFGMGYHIVFAYKLKDK